MITIAELLHVLQKRCENGDAQVEVVATMRNGEAASITGWTFETSVTYDEDRYRQLEDDGRTLKPAKVKDQRVRLRLETRKPF